MSFTFTISMESTVVIVNAHSTFPCFIIESLISHFYNLSRHVASNMSVCVFKPPVILLSLVHHS